MESILDMTTKDKLIEKQRELIKKLNRLSEYLKNAVEFGEDLDWEEVIDHKLGKIKQLESEISSLEAEIAKEKDEPKMSASEVLLKHGFKVNIHEHERDMLTQYFIMPILEAMEEYAAQFKH
jgi:hypothetical protein